ncbi:MAG TPA: hypothetical protein PLQ76_09620, partial [bacterium]|nr:hypothetical protein [bacterium]
SDAASKCAVTNAVNPNCNEMSLNTDYTTCDVDLKESAATKQVSYDAVPAGAVEKEWSCDLKKLDGSKRDGFNGRGKTMDSAIAAASKLCEKNAGRAACDTYAADSAHTSCVPVYSAGSEKPAVKWTCVLDKHSNARRNTFYGYGATKDEARNDAESGCSVTNPVNPNCHEMALNPKYTSCTVELLQQ